MNRWMVWFGTLLACFLAIAVSADAQDLGRGRYRVLAEETSSEGVFVRVRIGEDVPVRALVALANAGRDPSTTPITAVDIATANPDRVRYACTATAQTPVSRGRTIAHWQICPPGARTYVSIVDHLTLRIPRRHQTTDAERLEEMRQTVETRTRELHQARQELSQARRVQPPPPFLVPRIATPPPPRIARSGAPWALLALGFFLPFSLCVGAALVLRERRMTQGVDRRRRAWKHVASVFAKRLRALRETMVAREQAWREETALQLEDLRAHYAAEQGRITERHCEDLRALATAKQQAEDDARFLLAGKVQAQKDRDAVEGHAKRLDAQCEELRRELAEERGDRSDLLQRAHQGDALAKAEAARAELLQRIRTRWEESRLAALRAAERSECASAFGLLAMDQEWPEQVRLQTAQGASDALMVAETFRKESERLQKECLEDLSTLLGLPNEVGEAMAARVQAVDDMQSTLLALRAETEATLAIRRKFLEDYRRLQRENARLQQAQDSWSSVEKDRTAQELLADMREGTAESYLRVLLTAAYQIGRRVPREMPLRVTNEQFDDLCRFLDRALVCAECGDELWVPEAIMHLRNVHPERVIYEVKHTLPPPGQGGSNT